LDETLASTPQRHTKPATFELFLLARRRDLVTDQGRSIIRLTEALLSLFPALERALDLNSKGPLTLLTHYQTPTHLKRAGHKRIASYLRNRGVKGSNKLGQKAPSAAKSQSVSLPAQEVASRIVAELAKDILGLKERIESIDEELQKRFFARPEARILISLPGMGPILGAEFLVCVGDVSAFESADRLAAYAGLVPAARDSGKRVGNNKRMRGGNKSLKRIFYQSAFSSPEDEPGLRVLVGDDGGSDLPDDDPTDAQKAGQRSLMRASQTPSQSDPKRSLRAYGGALLKGRSVALSASQRTAQRRPAASYRSPPRGTPRDATNFGRTQF
jgi:hypothetical protein